MNKVWKIIGIVTVIALVGVAAFSAVALAQGPAGEPPVAPPWMNGPRQFGGPRGAMPFGPMGGGFLHSEELEDAMHAAIAGALGLTVEEFDAARADGQTLADIAAAQGVDLATVQEAMNGIRQQALQQAVEDGTITQAQADWMTEHMGARGLGFGGHRPGGCDGTGPAEGQWGMRGGRGMGGSFQGFRNFQGFSGQPNTAN